MINRLLLLCTCAMLALVSSPARADDNGPDAVGPKKIVLKGDMATLNLPAGFAFLGPEKTQKLLNEHGGGASGDELGLVVGTGKDSDFAIFLSYEKNGYVEDKDGDKIDADAILKSIKEGTEESNDKRKSNGLAPMHVSGWEEAPSYDKSRHVVIWGITAQSEGGAPVVNFNTRLLGREGVLSVNLACDADKLQQNKPESQKIQSAIEFTQGKRYADFKPGDKISAGGIAALILGGVLLKKAGILAFLAAFLKPMLVAGWKLIAVAFAGVVGGIKRIFGGRKREQQL